MKHTAVVLSLAALAGCGGARLPPPSPLFPLESAWKSPVEGGVDGPPVADAQRVYFVSGGGLHALDAAQGTPAWTTGGRTGALAIGQGLLVLREPDGTVWGIDPATGSARWKVASGIAGPLPAVVDGDRVLVAGGGVAALDAATGRSLWGAPGEPRVTAPPAASGALVLVGEADGTIRARDGATGTPRWAFATGSALLAPPAPDGRGNVVVGTTARMIVSLDADSGKRRWRWKVGADVQQAPVVIDQVAVVATLEAVLWGLGRGGGSMVWRSALPSRPLSGPLRFGSSVLVACHGLRPSESVLVGFDARNGRRLGDLKTPGELKWPPAVGGRTLFGALRDGTIVAWRLPADLPETPAPPPATTSKRHP